MENGGVSMGRFFRQMPVFASSDLMNCKQGGFRQPGFFCLSKGKRNRRCPNGVNLKQGGVMSLLGINIISRIAKDKPKISNIG